MARQPRNSTAMLARVLSLHSKCSSSAPRDIARTGLDSRTHSTGATMDFLYNIPAALLLVLALAVSIAVVAIGQTWVHRRYGKGDLLGHNEVGGIIIAV